MLCVESVAVKIFQRHVCIQNKKPCSCSNTPFFSGVWICITPTSARPHPMIGPRDSKLCQYLFGFYAVLRIGPPGSWTAYQPDLTDLERVPTTPDRSAFPKNKDSIK